MRKALSWAVVVILMLTFTVVGIGCKTTTGAETTAAVTAAATETTGAETTAAVTTAAEPVVKELTKVIWISPRGSIDVLDDVSLWVAKEMGYFKELGIDLIMEPGPMESLSTTKFVAEGRADVGFPSTGVLCQSIDTGMDVIEVYNRIPQDISDFAVKKDSDIKIAKDIEGKSISIGDAGWQILIDPMLVALGIDPKSVTYVVGGDMWGQAVDLGKVDVAFVWEGYRAQWESQGLDLRYFLGKDFSPFPGNGETIRRADLNDPERRQLWINFFKAVSMGQHFLRHNPRGGTQLVYNQLPVVREQMTPKQALDATQQIHIISTYGERELGGYGDMSRDSWEKYLNVISELGQTTRLLKIEEVITNELIPEINDFDRERVEKDAKEFVLDDIWKDVEVTGDW